MLNYPESISNEISAYRLNENGLNGYYPIGVGNFWHSGIHLSISSDTPVKPLISGKVIAYRIDKNYQKIDLPQKVSKEKLDEKYHNHKMFYTEQDGIYVLNEKIPSSEKKINFASNFILLEHFIQDRDSEESLKFYTLYTNIASTSDKQAYQEDFITDGKIHILKDEEKLYCSLIGPAGYDRDEKYIEISCFMEKSLFDYKFKSKKLIFLSADNYKDFYTREQIESSDRKHFYFTNRSRYVVKEIITSGNQTAKKIQLKYIAAYLPNGVDKASKNKTIIKKDAPDIKYVILNETFVYKEKTSNFNLINKSLDSFFSSYKGGKEYTVTNILKNGQTQILIDCSTCSPIWIVDNDNFSSELDVENIYTENENVDYYEECPLFYSFKKKEISSTNKIKGLTTNTCFDKIKKEYCEIDGLSDIYVEKQAFEKKCYENAFKWDAFFDNQEEFEDDIFCDKLSLLKKIDDSSVIKDIFGANRMISDEEMKMFFGPNDHSLEMKAVVKNLRRIECKHPLEFDKAKFEKIKDEYNKRKEWTMGSMSDNNANSLKSQSKISDIWTDGLSKIFKKNNFFFVHPVYFLNHLDKAGLFEFNPYHGKKYSEIFKTTTIPKIIGNNITETGESLVIDNPGFAPVYSNTGWGPNINGYTCITGFFNQDYINQKRGNGKTYKEDGYTFFTHEGIDFRGKEGTEIHAFIYGEVLAYGQFGSYGRTVFIANREKTGIYLLAHLSEYNISVLDKKTIAPGDVIGKVGTSGPADEKGNIDGKYDAHLHLTFFETNIYTDIYKYIKKQNNGTLSIGENYDNNKRRNPFDHTSKKKPNVKS